MDEVSSSNLFVCNKGQGALQLRPDLFRQTEGRTGGWADGQTERHLHSHPGKILFQNLGKHNQTFTNYHLVIGVTLKRFLLSIEQY